MAPLFFFPLSLRMIGVLILACLLIYFYFYTFFTLSYRGGAGVKGRRTFEGKGRSTFTQAHPPTFLTKEGF